MVVRAVNDAPFSFENICEVYKSMRRGYGAHFYDGVTRNWQVVSLGAFRDAVLYYQKAAERTCYLNQRETALHFVWTTDQDGTLIGSGSRHQ